MTTDNEELKCCPFCGAPAEKYTKVAPVPFDAPNTLQKEWAVDCTECDCNMEWEETEAEAVTNWNTRHVPEGYKLVPVKPTEAMEDAGVDASNTALTLKSVWKAMLEASEVKS